MKACGGNGLSRRMTVMSGKITKNNNLHAKIKMTIPGQVC